MGAAHGQTAQLVQAACDNFRVYLGEALKIAREGERLTQLQLAALLGDLLGSKLDQSYISKVESGDSGISLHRLVALCHILGWTPAKIVNLAECVSTRGEGESDTLVMRRFLRGGQWWQV